MKYSSFYYQSLEPLSIGFQALHASVTNPSEIHQDEKRESGDFEQSDFLSLAFQFEIYDVQDKKAVALNPTPS